MLVSAYFFIAFGAVFTVDLKYATDLLSYFICEGIGNYPGKADCDRSAIDNSFFPILVSVAVYMFTAIPSVSLVYVVNWRDTRDLFKKLQKRVKTTSSYQGNGTV